MKKITAYNARLIVKEGERTWSTIPDYAIIKISSKRLAEILCETYKTDLDFSLVMESKYYEYWHNTTANGYTKLIEEKVKKEIKP
jgi:hypothetical protein